jgi:VanZ family protein
VLHRHPALSLLTGGYLAFVAWVTLTPQAYASAHIGIIYRVLDALHRRGHLLSIDDVELEFLANIALFVPVGMFLLLLVGTRFWWAALIASFALTAFIEAAQRSIPGRVPDEQDLIANGLGAVIGALVALLLTLPAEWRRRRRRRSSARTTVTVEATRSRPMSSASR